MEDLKLTLIQSDLHWENIEANLAMFEEKIWQIDGPTDLIVLPEMFTTGFTMNARELSELMNGKTFRWMKQQAAQTKAVVIGSYMIVENHRYFNRLFAINPDGSYSTYDKRHLFGLAGEADFFTGGSKRTILTVKGWRVMPLICYDLRFPVWARSRQSAENLFEYDLLLYVASWPAPRIQAWDTLLKARAIENTSYSAGVNRIGKDATGAEYPGHSACYDYKGDPMGFSENEEILTLSLPHRELEVFRSRFPFQKDADRFSFL